MNKTKRARTPRPRFGSAADLAAYSSLGPKTVRRLAGLGLLRPMRVGRRVLFEYSDLDKIIRDGVERLAQEATPASAEGPGPPPEDDGPTEADREWHRDHPAD